MFKNVRFFWKELYIVKPKSTYRPVFFLTIKIAAACPQIPVLFLPPTITALSISFLALNAFYYYRKRT